MRPTCLTPLILAAVATLAAGAAPPPPAGCGPRPTPFCADPAWPDTAAAERAPAPPKRLRAGPIDPLPAGD